MASREGKRTHEEGALMVIKNMGVSNTVYESPKLTSVHVKEGLRLIGLRSLHVCNARTVHMCTPHFQLDAKL